MYNLKFMLGPMRPPFLILTPACVLLGLGTAMWSSGNVSLLYFLLALLGALSTHVSVNAFNEYFDFRSGLDTRTRRTPFSGGSGTLPQKPHLAPYALAMAIGALAVTSLVGLYFLSVRGPAILPLGILGLFVVVAYTPWLTHNPVLCLIAPGLGFGPLMVMGTHFVLTGTYSWTAYIASMIPFFLVSDLLLLNQFPDVEADKTAGRRHFPLIIGRRRSSILYGAFLLGAFLSILIGVNLGYLPGVTLLGLIALIFAVPAFVGAFRHSDDLDRLIPYMGINVIVNIATPVLVAVGLFIG